MIQEKYYEKVQNELFFFDNKLEYEKNELDVRLIY